MCNRIDEVAFSNKYDCNQKLERVLQNHISVYFSK
jgi:hypothetical protein